MPLLQADRLTGWACSSVVEHCVDIAGVASSILATPTIFSPENSDLDEPDRCTIGPVQARFAHENATYLGIYWARNGHVLRVNTLLGTNIPCEVLTRTSREQIFVLGAGHSHVSGGRLHGWTQARRLRISGRREVLGQGSAGVEQRVFPVSRIKKPARVRPSRRAGVVAVEESSTQPHNPVRMTLDELAARLELGGEASNATSIGRSEYGLAEAESARDPPATGGIAAPLPATYLLTPEDIVARLQVDTTDTTRWVRRIFKQHGVPLTRVRGRWRATLGQFDQLVEQLSCSACVGAGKRKSTTSVARSRSVTAASRSVNTVQERVTEMLRRTR